MIPGGNTAENPQRRSILWRWRRFLFLLALMLVAGVAGAGYVLSSIPLPPEEIQAETSFIFDAARRATISVAPPGACPTTKRIGFTG